MATFGNLNKEIEADLLTVRQKDVDIKDLKYKTEKHDYENILKSLKSDNEYYKKKYKSLNKKKIYISILEILTGASGVIVGSTLTATGVGATIGVPIAGVSAFLASIATLITNEYLSKRKARYTKLRDYINMITLLYEKTLTKSMMDKKIDEKEGEELKQIYNHHLEKKKNIMNNTRFSVEEVFGKMNVSDTINAEQIQKLNTFLAKIM